VAEVEARADLLEAADPVEDLEQAPVVLEVDLLEAVLVARLLQAGPAVLVVAEVPALVPVVQAELLAVQVAAAVAVRIPLLIPRMAKFPTRRLLARSPTT